ncbi:MAG: cation:proton antiporter [Bacilli bacterium]|nr:cation:proton antiporter [Bacilli bacterium]
MLLSLSLMLLVGLSVSYIFKLLKIPSILGYMITGIILGPYVLNLIAPEILNISADLRTIALVVILLRAGLSLNIKDLKQIGITGVLMAFIPASFEIVGVVIFAPILLGLSLIDSLILGTILGAVSPAIIVPKMLKLMESKEGTRKSIPQLILAGASMDDIYCLVLFASAISLAQNHTLNFATFVHLPESIIFGIGLGIGLGFIFNYLFRKIHMRDTLKVIIVLTTAILLTVFEDYIKKYVGFSSLLAVIALGITLLTLYPKLASRMVRKYEKIWLVAEILLFVLVGAAVNILTIKEVGLNAIILILIILLFRTLGVIFATLPSKLKFKEKVFVVFAYLPKATVQASIGAIPLEMGFASGGVMLSVSVLAILITATLGSFLIDITHKTLLEKDSVSLEKNENKLAV